MSKEPAINIHKLRLSHIGKAIANFFFPPSCVSCGTVTPRNTTDSLCEQCRTKYNGAKSSAQAQYNGKVAVPIEIVGKYRTVESFIASVVNYRPMTLNSGFIVQKQIIFQLKRHNYKRLVDFVAGEITALINEVFSGTLNRDKTVIVNIPRNPMNYIKSANDGVKNISTKIAQDLGIEYIDAFRKRLFTKEQKFLSARQRKENGGGLYLKASIAERFDRKDVIIIDDVVTTGATVCAAAKLLADNTHVRNIFIFSFAQSNFNY